ncbi:MAG: VWA domain-containing protein [Oscillospiraceae bacterium]|nr:VWA domain-containing protein [Oscillospiraceae bacterium]
MTDPAVYLEKVCAFSRMLRLEGLTVGNRETEDACRLLTVLGLEDRGQVKTALRTVYAKSREEQETFDRVFDGFFLPEEAMRRQAEEAAKEDARVEQARQQAEEELLLNGQPMDFDEAQRDAYASMPDRERKKLRNFMDRYRESAARNPDLYSNFIHSVFARSILEQQMLMEDAALGCGSSDPDLGLLYRDISEFKDVEIPKAIAAIQTVSQQLNGELSAKRSRGGHGGKLDFRRTIRRGLGTGGSLYRLAYRKKHQRKKKLVLLCDVSGSMVQFSEFALRFIQSLNHVSESSRTFLFSEETVEADVFSLENMNKFREYVRQSGTYGRGTDVGKALQTLCTMTPPVLSDATTLLILSDTKTVDLQKALTALKEAKRQAGRVLWLNPIPQRKWQHLRSAQAISEVCQMASCNTLRDLQEACRKIAAGQG